MLSYLLYDSKHKEIITFSINGAMRAVSEIYWIDKKYCRNKRLLNILYKLCKESNISENNKMFHCLWLRNTSSFIEELSNCREFMNKHRTICHRYLIRFGNALVIQNKIYNLLSENLCGSWVCFYLWWYLAWVSYFTVKPIYKYPQDYWNWS